MTGQLTTVSLAAVLLAAQLELTLVNKTGGDKTVVVRTERTDSTTVIVEANSSRRVNLKNLKKHERYSAAIIDSRGNPSIGAGYIPKAVGNFVDAFQIPEVVYPEDALSHFTGLAETIGVGDKLYDRDVVPMVDLLPQLGSVIVATRHEGGRLEYHTHIALRNVELPDRMPERMRHSIISNRDVLTNFAFRPLFWGLSLRMNMGSVYSLSYTLDKTSYMNSFEVQDALMHASDADLEQIYNALAGIDGATLYTIHSFVCIENAMFTLVEGEVVSADAGVDLATVLTGAGRYSFAHQRETFVDAQDICLSVVPAKIANRSFMLAYLKSRLNGEKDLFLGAPSKLEDQADNFTKSIRHPSG